MSSGNKVVELPTRKQLDAEAAAWLVKLDQDEVKPATIRALRDWLAENNRHKEAFERISRFWDGLSVLEELEDIAESTHELEPDKRIWFSRRQGFSIASSLALLVGGGAAYLVYHNLQPDQYVTAVGEQRAIRLTDGSEIQLNTDSHIEVAINQKSRVVKLLKGEAHFVVATDPQRPFSVRAGRGVFTAIGTAYTVRLRPSSAVEITVSEGRVAMSPEPTRSRSKQSVQLPVNDGQDAALEAGQNAVFTDRVRSVQEISRDDLARKGAWRYGQLSYAGEPLSDVIADISRYTEMRINIADSDIKSLPVGGSFRVGEIDALFETLEITFDLQIEYLDGGRVLISKKS